MLKHENISIYWLGHDGFRIEKDLVLYIDPFQLKEPSPRKADIIFITHHHSDHCSPEDIKKVLTEETLILCTKQSQEVLKDLNASFRVVGPAQTFSERGIRVDTIPAYNVNKYRDPVKKVPFHPKEDNLVGYVFDIDGVKIYHTGDSDFTDEMKKVRCDIALLPVSGTYVMTAEEAAEAAKAIGPKIAIPMHWGAIVGDKTDAERFRDILQGRIPVKILMSEE